MTIAIDQDVFETAVESVIDNTPAIVTWGWDDLTNSIVGKNLDSTRDKIDLVWEENSIKFQQQNLTLTNALADANIKNCITFNLQKLHSVKQDSELRLHIHWEQSSTDAVQWGVKYRIQGNGAARTTGWTTLPVATSTEAASAASAEQGNVFAYTSGTLNQITKLGVVDWSAVAISSTVQFRMGRVDASGTAVIGDQFATFIDGHVQYDQRGSIQEFDKNAAS